MNTAPDAIDPNNCSRCDHGETNTTIVLPVAPDADDRADFDAWVAEHTVAAIELLDADAPTRDDGTLYHDRTLSEDVDFFNPHIVARAPARLEIVPAPMSASEVA